MEFDLQEMMIRMKKDRKEEELSEIDHIFSSGVLLPGHAGKLKGKLMLRTLRPDQYLSLSQADAEGQI